MENNMSDSTELVVSLKEHIVNVGVMSDNAWDVSYAIEKCHEALCPMDDEQLSQIHQAIPELIQLANQYAMRTPGKRVFKLNDYGYDS
jgi:hypothetical protein